METADLIKRGVRRALSALRQPFRARLTALSGAGGVQLAQGEALSGERMQAVELMQQFGFTSGVPAGSQLVILPLGGQTAHSVIVATENGAFRVRVEAGETAVYNQWGARVVLKKERIVAIDCDRLEVDARERILFRTRDLVAQADAGIRLRSPSLAFEGAEGRSASAAMNADLRIQGSVTSSGDQVAAGVSQTGHRHGGVETGSGDTGPPR